MAPKRKLTSQEEAPPQPTSTSANEQSSSDLPTTEQISHFTVPLNEKKPIPCEKHGPNGPPQLIFTHGAGGGIADGPTRDFAAGFGELATITCFQGNLNLKSRIKAFHAVLGEAQNTPALGGRSMGARAAVLTALERCEASDSDSRQPSALVLVSYPLRAGSKGETREYDRREKILKDLPAGVDVLFVSGTRDLQCPSDELKEMRREMRARSWLVRVQDADHGLGIRQKDGVEALRRMCGRVAAEWLEGRDEGLRERVVGWDDEGMEMVAGDWKSGDDADAEDWLDAHKRARIEA